MTGRPSFRGASELPPQQADLRREQATERAIKTAMPEWVKSGRLVSATLTDANSTKVSHGLKRGVQGWFIGSLSGDADMTNVRQTSSDSESLTLVNSGATGSLSLTLWVY